MNSAVMCWDHSDNIHGHLFQWLQILLLTICSVTICESSDSKLCVINVMYIAFFYLVFSSFPVYNPYLFYLFHETDEYANSYYAIPINMLYYFGFFRQKISLHTRIHRSKCEFLRVSPNSSGIFYLDIYYYLNNDILLNKLLIKGNSTNRKWW